MVVQKNLEEARQKGVIGSSLEAQVTFKTADKDTKAFLQQTLDLWPEIAIVSAVEIADGTEPLSIEVTHAKGTKCARCWQWKTDVGSHPVHNDVCGRCAAVLEKEGITVNADEKVRA